MRMPLITAAILLAFAWLLWSCYALRASGGRKGALLSSHPILLECAGFFALFAAACLLSMLFGKPSRMEQGIAWGIVAFGLLRAFAQLRPQRLNALLDLILLALLLSLWVFQWPASALPL